MVFLAYLYLLGAHRLARSVVCTCHFVSCSPAAPLPISRVIHFESSYLSPAVLFSCLAFPSFLCDHSSSLTLPLFSSLKTSSSAPLPPVYALLTTLSKVLYVSADSGLLFPCMPLIPASLYSSQSPSARRLRTTICSVTPRPQQKRHMIMFLPLDRKELQLDFLPKRISSAVYLFCLERETP